MCQLSLSHLTGGPVGRGVLYSSLDRNGEIFEAPTHASKGPVNKNLNGIVLAVVLLVFSTAIAGKSETPAQVNSALNGKEAWENNVKEMLQSPDPVAVTRAYEALGQAFRDNPAEAEATFHRIHRLCFLRSDHFQDVRSLVDEALRLRSGGERGSQEVGYLYVVRALVELISGKEDTADEALHEGLRVDAEGCVDEATKVMCPQLIGQNRYDDLGRLLVKFVETCQGEAKVLEPILTEYIVVLNSADKRAEAAGCAKLLFEVSTMEHTADALVILSHQVSAMYASDLSTIQKFRLEETNGAELSQDGEAPHTSSVVLGLSTIPPFFSKKVLPEQNSASGAYVLSMQLLLMGKSDAALVAGRRSYALADNPKDIQKGIFVVACCLKAVDGTIGRANAWVVAAQASLPAPPRHAKSKRPKKGASTSQPNPMSAPDGNK